MFEHLRFRGDTSHGGQDVPGLVERFVLLVIPCVLLTTEAGVEKESKGGGGGRVKNAVRKGEVDQKSERGRERIGERERRKERERVE